MNLLLLDQSDWNDKHTVTLTDHRFEHCRRILKAKAGDRLTVGLVNHGIGQAEVSGIDKTSITLTPGALEQTPPAPLPLTVIMALPRPQVLKRVVHNIAEFGIKQLHLLHCDKVEKSYWQSRTLAQNALHEQLCAGLMQSKDTLLPAIHLHRHFDRFVDDVLPSITQTAQTFIAHPYTDKHPPQPSHQARAVIIGPEGGFTDREMRRFEQQNVIAVSMGARIYRVENAMTLLAGQLSLAAENHLPTLENGS